MRKISYRTWLSTAVRSSSSMNMSFKWKRMPSGMWSFEPSSTVTWSILAREDTSDNSQPRRCSNTRLCRSILRINCKTQDSRKPQSYSTHTAGHDEATMKHIPVSYRVYDAHTYHEVTHHHKLVHSQAVYTRPLTRLSCKECANEAGRRLKALEAVHKLWHSVSQFLLQCNWTSYYYLTIKFL